MIKRVFQNIHFQKKYLIIIIPVILLLVLLVAAAPGAIYREHRYRTAVNALHDGKLDTAQELLSDIPLYRDSDTILNREIPYLRAEALLEAAENNDTAALEAAGLSAPDGESTAAMMLYEAADEIYSSLGDYKESTGRSETCQAGIKAQQQLLRDQAAAELLRQNQETYDHALALLESGAYSEALEVFDSLGDFSDCAEMAFECRYRKAVSVFHFLSRYDVSRVYALLSMETDKASIFSLPSEEALRLGSGCIDDLRASCGQDPIDIRLEDTPAEQLLPLKEALKAFFEEMDGYSDSASFPAQIDEETDYTRDFFMLCRTGDLNAARNWLNAYQGNFPEREKWSSLLELYLPYCGNWELYLGDAGLLPYTVGETFSSMSVSSRVILEQDEALLRLSFGEGNSVTFDLPSELGETLFIADLDSGYYMGALNNRHFVYMRYDRDWKLLSSCDYIPAV